MHFKKILPILMMTFFLTMPSVFAFSLFSENTQQIISQTWDAQTLQQLKDGVVAVPQPLINEYLKSVLTDSDKIKSAQISIHPDNKLEANVDTVASGKVILSGTILQLVQNKDKSLMKVHIDKKELAGSPVTSWIFSRMSIGMLTKLFGNPLNDNDYGIVTSADGNTLSVDFKDFIAKSQLNNAQFMGNKLIDAVNIDSVSTDEGVLYLHTSFNVSNMALNALTSIL